MVLFIPSKLGGLLSPDHMGAEDGCGSAGDMGGGDDAGGGDSEGADKR